MLTAINPADGKKIRTYKENSEKEVDDKVKTAYKAYTEWRETTFPQRVERLRNAARVLVSRKDEYADLMAREMGKPIRDGRAEIEKCVWACNFYADKALSFLQPEIIETDACRSYVTFKPLGVILAIMPWNYPFWQVFRFAAPALMAGNAAVLKHASNVPGCSLALEDIFKTAGFPQNLFQNVLLSSRRMDSLIRHPAIQAVTLTGSQSAGRAVAAAAGKLLKKTVLELGVAIRTLFWKTPIWKERSQPVWPVGC